MTKVLLPLLGAPPLPMDAVPAATWTVAYGVKALTKKWYGKSLFDISISGTTTTISALSNGLCDVATLASTIGIDPKTGIGGAYCTKWYDQSGAGQNATGTTGVNCPWIALIYGEVFIATDGWLSDNLNGAFGSDKYLTLPSLSFNNQNMSYFSVTDMGSSSTQYYTNGSASATFFSTGTAGSVGTAFACGPKATASVEDWATFANIVPQTFLTPPAQKSVVSGIFSSSNVLFGFNENLSASSTPLSANTATGGYLFTGLVAFAYNAGLYGRTQAVLISPSVLTSQQQTSIRKSLYSAFSICKGTINVLIDGASVDYGTGAYLNSSTDGSCTASGFGWDQQLQRYVQNVGRNVEFFNTSAVGIQLGQLAGTWSTNQKNYYNPSATKNVLFAGGYSIYNSLNAGSTATSLFADMQTYIAGANAAGSWNTKFVFAMTSYGSPTYYAQYMNLLQTNASALGITIIDPSTLLPAGYNTNPTYVYQSGPSAGHFTLLGYQLQAQAILPSLLAVI